MNLKNKRILICKTNQIGDVTFALPIATALKKTESAVQVIFLGRAYTQSLIEHYNDVDEFSDWDQIKDLPDEQAAQALAAINADVIFNIQADKRLAKLAKMANIPVRVGTLGRLYNWKYCNKLISLSRKKSPLHETQLDMYFLKGVGLPCDYSLQEIAELQNYRAFEPSDEVSALLDPNKFNLILHPKTRGQHIEWPFEHFAELISSLPEDKVNLMVTGSAEEGAQFAPQLIERFPQVTNVCGKVSLSGLCELISRADGLIAASTGPVHLAANFGIHTLGLYAPIKPMHAGRWGPVGKQAEVLNIEKDCSDCRTSGPCHCVAAITPPQVNETVMRWVNS